MTKAEMRGYSAAENRYKKGSLIDFLDFELAAGDIKESKAFKRGWFMFAKKVHHQSFKRVLKAEQIEQSNLPAGVTLEDYENFEEDMKDMFWDEYDQWIDSVEAQYRKDKHNGVVQE